MLFVVHLGWIRELSLVVVVQHSIYQKEYNIAII